MMATGLDELIDFLLSEIALCGVQGAGSADFFRFIKVFYERPRTQHTPLGDDQDAAHLTPSDLGRAFHERVWDWVSNHPDIRITSKDGIKHYSLSEFELAEAPNISTTVSTSAADITESLHTPESKTVGPSNALLSIRGLLRERLREEGRTPVSTAVSIVGKTSSTPSRQSPRNVSQVPRVSTSVFDEPDTASITPRLYASQNRTWQALTGHGIDLKKVPSMEFVLLSLIAARGSEGITQPELTQISGQDKRSVPNRTNELARKGYIVKNPVQTPKVRTSLCVHVKFFSSDHFLTSAAVEDVYREGRFVLSGFVHLLHSKLKDSGPVLARNIRKELDVPMQTWNKRATQGALIRLAQTGMIKRFRVRAAANVDSWYTCIQVLREPREEDVVNLGFRRQPTDIDETADELLGDDLDEDTLIRDLEVDLLNDVDADVDTHVNGIARADVDVPDRIPPQWTPDQFLANMVFDVTALGGPFGWDAATIRNRIMGQFWRRPMESYIARMTDDWEKTQPQSLRHLAVIKDLRNTEEKKFIHYVYRTYNNFQEAVEAGEVRWEGVSLPTKKESGSKKGPRLEEHMMDTSKLDNWGFQPINKKAFVHRDGSATLSEARSVIVHPRKYATRWDDALAEDIGYLKADRKIAKPKAPVRVAEREGEKVPKIHKSKSKSKKKIPVVSITPEQRISIGLKPHGRLTKFAENQIIAHRERVGDPTALPKKIDDEPASHSKKPLMTREERIANGLPERGRLGIAAENKLRAERGLPKHIKKPKKTAKTANEPALITSKQRLGWGWTVSGRLPQALIDGLRQEREDNISIENSKIIPQYMDILKAKGAAARVKTKDNDADNETNTVLEYQPSPEPVDINHEVGGEPSSSNVGLVLSTTPAAVSKRKAADQSNRPNTSKGQHMGVVHQQENSIATELSDPTVVLDDDPLNSGSHDTQLAEPPKTTLEQSEIEVSALLPEREVDLDPVITTSPLMEDTVVANREAPQSEPSTISSSMNPVHLENQALNHDSEVTATGINEQSAVILYLTPITRLRKRGRPRSRVAVFKLPRLGEFEWFRNSTSSQSSTTQDAQAPETSMQKNHAAAEQTSADATAELNPHESAFEVQKLSSIHAMSAEQQPGVVDSATSTTALQEHARHGTRLPDSFAGTAKLLLDAESQILNGQSLDHINTSLTTNAVFESSEGRSLQLPRKVHGWNSINTSARSSPTTYQSPYADVVPPDTISPPQTLRNVNNTERSAATFILPESLNTGEHGDTTPAHETFGAISEMSGPPSLEQKLGKKKLPQTLGSTLIIRRDIILEILKLCKGVYPDQGEIGRPFCTLWEKKHGSKGLKMPIASTVMDTMRNMCHDPKSGLKQMFFFTPNRQGSTNVRKKIIAYSHLTPSSPEVRRLAYNIAYNSSEKSNQFFPEEIRHLVDDKNMYVPAPVAPKDKSITLDQLYPDMKAQKQLSKNIRRNQLARNKRQALNAQRLQNAQMKKAASKQAPATEDTSRTRRSRLASLNDKKKQYHRTLRPQPADDITREEGELDESHKASTMGVKHPTYTPLTWMRPMVAPIVERHIVEIDVDSTSETEESDDESVDLPNREARDHTGLNHEVSATAQPQIVDTATAAEAVSVATNEVGSSNQALQHFVVDPKTTQKVKKRVRIADPAEQSGRKRRRLSTNNTESTQGHEYAHSSDNESDTPSDSEVGDDDEQNKKGRNKASKKYQKGRKGPLPTLLERLTGLTGDPNDPVYQPTQRERGSRSKFRPWNERRKQLRNARRRERRYFATMERMDQFKKICFALVIASSMAGGDGVVDWGIINMAYSSDRFFNLARTEKLWVWIQANLAEQLLEMTSTFQSAFLDAYENGQVDAIENPETYNWSSLVQWAIRKCTFPELSLSLYQEATYLFDVEESSYEALDRTNWYKTKIADRVRTHMQLQYAFSAPLHRSRAADWSSDDKVLKARSWIRANTATPQILYDGSHAHDKLMILGEKVLTSVVGDYVDKKKLRMRRLKRLLPGRNYSFTQAFAKKYVRPFELGDLMAAVKTKKDLDAVFSNADPEKRFYSISRSEEDGSFTAVMTLLSEGRVKYMPQLPPVNNEFGAALPRLSVWGFCEGDYIHRAIDRDRMFWDIHVVPTGSYQFSNPLQPLPAPSATTGVGELTDWPPLPDPPLPGKSDPNALLPIWSSIDGQSITWPWWYRILNLVLQPLIFQPGATAKDVKSHCPEHTTEVFEIQLVLDWLETVNAVSKTIGDGYITHPCFWATLGDKLLDSEDDWFGEHVKRKAKNHQKQLWREEYNLRHSTLQARGAQRADAEVGAEIVEEAEVATEASTSQRILSNPRQQYRIMNQMLDAQLSEGEEEGGVTEIAPGSAGIQEQAEVTGPGQESTAYVSRNPGLANTPIVDTDMADADEDAMGGDEDAEGDIDDAIF